MSWSVFCLGTSAGCAFVISKGDVTRDFFSHGTRKRKKVWLLEKKGFIDSLKSHLSGHEFERRICFTCHSTSRSGRLNSLRVFSREILGEGTRKKATSIYHYIFTGRVEISMRSSSSYTITQLWKKESQFHVFLKKGFAIAGKKCQNSRPNS